MPVLIIKRTVQLMFFITMIACLFIEPVIIDYFKYFVFPFPIGSIVFVLLGLLLILSFWE